MKEITSSFTDTRRINCKTDEFFDYTNFSDVSYFKQIRAIFGQHPSNLDATVDGNRRKVFASHTFVRTSTNSVMNCEGDIYCKLYYDVHREGWGKNFNLVIKELEKFTNHVIECIIYYCKEIKRVIYNYKKSLIIPIEEWSNTKPISCKTNLLIEAITDRHCNSCNEWFLIDELRELENLLNIQVSSRFDKYYAKYNALVSNKVDEIHRIITLNSSNLESYDNINDFKAINDYYVTEKVYEYIHGKRYYDIYTNVCSMICLKLNINKISNENEFKFYMFVLKEKGVSLINKN